MTRYEIMNTLSKLKRKHYFSSIRIGLAGSYARGENQYDSDIDVVVDADSMSIEHMEEIKGSFGNEEVDVLLLGLLKQEDEELDSLLFELNLPINEDSVYKNVAREVVWCE